MRLLIIGGSDAGISAALRAREVAPHVQMVECGLLELWPTLLLGSPVSQELS